MAVEAERSQRSELAGFPHRFNQFDPTEVGVGQINNEQVSFASSGARGLRGGD